MPTATSTPRPPFSCREAAPSPAVRRVLALGKPIVVMLVVTRRKATRTETTVERRASLKPGSRPSAGTPYPKRFGRFTKCPHDRLRAFLLPAEMTPMPTAKG